MRWEKLFLMSCLSWLSFCSIELFAENTMEIECRYRIEKLDNDLKQVLNSHKYSWKNRIAFKRALKNAGLTSKTYEAYIMDLKSLMTKDSYGSIPDGNALKCLLDTGDLVQKLDRVAELGGKSLDDFSKDWKKYFPSYAKALGYSARLS